ncbi:MAG: transcriptional regulator [Rhodobacterales bacterium]|nr:MAG: transcriptional regulator [Rhodobacterales bacterium]
MARSDRLFRLLDTIRRLPAPITAARLAEETGVSLRTLYRDIDALRAGGARIEGEAGLGYTLTEDPALPPQQLSRLEVEALTLGLSAIRDYADRELVTAGETALAKIIARLNDDGQRAAMHAVLRNYAPVSQAAPNVAVTELRRACWDELAIDLTYEDKDGARTERRVWPLCIIYMDNALLLVAHCLLRKDARSFRLDRIHSMTLTGDSFRPQRAPLLRRYSTERKAGRAPRQ